MVPDSVATPVRSPESTVPGAMGSFRGRTALVTGGARGIGRAICRMLAAEGARVAINYATNERAAQETLDLVRSAGAEGVIVAGDVSQPDDVSRVIDQVRQRFGPVELLVNNAGIAASCSHEEVLFEDWKRMFAVNVDGPFLTTWGVKDEMIHRRFGRIVNISSLAGLKMKARMIHYATTKSAVISFTRHCAEAFAPFNIRVNCVAPGLTNTELAQSANPDLIQHLISVTPMKRIGEPDEIARVVRFLLSDDSSFMTAQTVSVCGGRV